MANTVASKATAERLAGSTPARGTREFPYHRRGDVVVTVEAEVPTKADTKRVVKVKITAESAPLAAEALRLIVDVI